MEGVQTDRVVTEIQNSTWALVAEERRGEERELSL